MAIDVPESPKVHTTVYENFKGVDYTNDSSNVWYRRTPSGVNMLPDEAGRPFKRTGWMKVVEASDFADLYASDNSETAPSEIEIRKCYYFDLAGSDHIVIFTNYGVFVYRDGTLLSSKSFGATNTISYDDDMIGSYERAFFFEGNGKSAFYIYGGFKIWEYSYSGDGNFAWREVEPYIPRVNISVDARHESGTFLETVNLLSDYICEDFQNNTFAYVASSSTTVPSSTLTVDETQFLAMQPEVGTYTFTYSSDEHSWILGGDQVYISNYGINLQAPSVSDGKTITVTTSTAYRINLPKFIVSIDGMSVLVSEQTQFDTPLTMQFGTETVQTKYYCTVKTPSLGENSYIQFYYPWLPIVDGEDAIRVVYPRNAVSWASYRYPTSGQQEINVGA